MIGEKIIQASGFLFVGDPHLRSRRPGKRKEKNFGEVVLKKLEQAIGIANEKKLVFVELGDLIDKYYEEDESLKTRVLRQFGGLWTEGHGNTGNHEMKGIRLSDSDTLSVIASSGRLKICQVSGPVGIFDFDGVKVGLGMTPYGQAIPRDVSDLFTDVSGVIWITHHDIAFEGAYPGAMEAFEIKGCNLVINGHNHLYKEAITVGSTMWFNPGNITRLSLDAINHEPAVWEFTPANGLVRHILDYNKDAFDLTGRLVEAIKDDTMEDHESLFVSLLGAELENGPAATPDGVGLLEEIEQQFEREKTGDSLRKEILALFHQASEREETKRLIR